MDIRREIGEHKSRLDIMFRALKDVQKIVGRGADKENIYKQIGSHDTI